MKKIEVNGSDDLKKPLLQTQEDVTPGTLAPQIKDMKSSHKNKNLNRIMVSPLHSSPATPNSFKENKIKETIEDTRIKINELKGENISECRIKIKGMTCTSCSQSVEQALQMVDGVKKAVVGLALEEVKVLCDPKLFHTNNIIEAVEDAGFGAELIISKNDMNKVHLKLEGVESQEDLNVIVSSLNLSDGVNHVELDLTEQKVTVNYDSDITGPIFLIHCIQEASSGNSVYQATLHTNSGKRELEKVNEIRHCCLPLGPFICL